MVERYVGHYSQLRCDDIGAVEASAKSYLNHSRVHAAVGEVAQSHDRRKLEECGMQRRQYGIRKIAVDELADIFFGNHDAVNSYAFAEIDQMRRGEKPRAVACALQYGRNGARRGAFAIGTAYVDCPQFFLRRAECLRQTPGGFKPRFVGAGSEILEHRHLSEKKFTAFFVIHRFRKVSVRQCRRR